MIPYQNGWKKKTLRDVKAEAPVDTLPERLSEVVAKTIAAILT